MPCAASSPKAAQEFITPLVGRRACRRAGVHGPVRCRDRVRRRPYPAGARGRPHRGRAGDRRSHGQDGGRPRRRSRLGGAARDRPAGADRARDESAACGSIRRPGAISRSLVDDGVAVVGPNAGEMAEAGEAGIGRMAEPLEIVAAAMPLLDNAGNRRALAGRRVVVTSGPTHEPIDPVRYIANRSSGKQGHAIAAAAAAAGADVTLVSGPVNLPDPAGVKVVKVETARDMLAAVSRGTAGRCRGVRGGRRRLARRPTERGQDQEAARRARRNSGWSKTPTSSRPSHIARAGGHVSSSASPPRPTTSSRMPRPSSRARAATGSSPTTSRPATGVMGGDQQHRPSRHRGGVESWPPQSKDEVARALVTRIAGSLAGAER